MRAEALHSQVLLADMSRIQNHNFRTTMIKKITLSIIFLSGVLFGGDAETNVLTLKLYPYIFLESTGENKFTLEGKSIIPIKGFSKESDAKRLSVLLSLKQNILYQNGDGNKIFLIGNFEDDGLFNLKNWFIVSPFLSYDIVDEEVLPQESKLTKRVKFQAADFSIDVPNMNFFVRAIE